MIWRQKTPFQVNRKFITNFPNDRISGNKNIFHVKWDETRNKSSGSISCRVKRQADKAVTIS